MKKIILTAVAVFGFAFANAQAKFGLTAGVDFASAKVTIPGDVSVSSSETGFYIGGLVDFTASDKFHIQPELLLVIIDDSKQLQLPILAKYYVGEKFSLLAGPDVLFDLENEPGFKTVGLGLDFGGAYDINKNFSIEARYNFGLSNLFEDAPSGYKATISGLFVGVGYKF